MKKKIVGILVCTLLIATAVFPLCRLGAGAQNFVKDDVNNKKNVENRINPATHTVLAEFGTASGCGYCLYAHKSLEELYAEEQLDFYYVTMVKVQNPHADTRFKIDYNVVGVPAVAFDGGYRTQLGASDMSIKNTYANYINDCEMRTVKDIEVYVFSVWHGIDDIRFLVLVLNHEKTDYEGHVRVYITEKESSYYVDKNNDPYTMAFLDYAVNEQIYIPAERYYMKTFKWNALEAEFDKITKDNLMIIAAVFNAEWHQGVWYHTQNYYFDAYYVDDTASLPVIKGKRLQQIQDMFVNFLLLRHKMGESILNQKSPESSIQVRHQLDNSPKTFPILRQLLSL